MQHYLAALYSVLKLYTFYSEAEEENGGYNSPTLFLSQIPHPDDNVWPDCLCVPLCLSGCHP